MKNENCKPVPCVPGTGLVNEIRNKWKPRPKNSHKGDFGRVFILAGSKGLTGAAYLAGFSALKSGAGLVTLGVPESIYSVCARRAAELMVRPFPATREGTLSLRALKPILQFAKNQDVLGLGPGLSQNEETQKLIRGFCRETTQPVVLDADGLNAFAGHLKELTPLRGRAILTPHPGEFKRLFGSVLSSSGLTGGSSAVDSRFRGNDKNAVQIANQYQIILVLKGHRTIVASPEGSCYINRSGNPGMATAGTGDVLTGVISALIGQGFSLRDGARFGVYFHGLAGDLALKKYGEVGLTASNLVEFLPFAFRQVLKR